MNILNICPEIAKCVLSYAASKMEWYKILLKVIWQYLWPRYSSFLETYLKSVILKVGKKPVNKDIHYSLT